MGYAISFKDGVTYGASDVNNITARLTGAGVQTAFVDSKAYNIEDLNQLTTALVAEGTNAEGCKCTIDTVNNVVTVGKGIAFMSDGSVVEIDSSGVQVPYTEGAVNYIYLVYEPTTQTVSFNALSSISSNGSDILLATVDESENLTDTRKIASAKIATLGKNVSRVEELTFNSVQLNPDRSYGTILWRSNFDISKFNYIICNFTNGDYAAFNIKENRGVFAVCAPLNHTRSIRNDDGTDENGYGIIYIPNYPYEGVYLTLTVNGPQIEMSYYNGYSGSRIVNDTLTMIFC